MKNILGRITNYCLYLLVFLLPIFFLPFSLEVYEFNKQFLLFFLVSLAFFVWLVKMVAFDKEIKFRRTALDIPVLIFMLVMILSTAFSVDKPASILGFYGRFSDGLVGVLSLAMMYFLITNKAGQDNVGQESASVNSGQGRALESVFLASAGLAVLMSYFSLFGIWAIINNQLSLITNQLPLSFVKGLSLPTVMLQRTFNPVAGSLEGLAVFLAVVMVMLVGRLLGKEDRPRLLLKMAECGFLVAVLGLLIIIDFSSAWIVLGLSLTIFLVFALWSRQFKERINVLLLPIFLIIISLGFTFIDAPDLSQNLNIKQIQNLPKEILLDQGTSWHIAWQSLKLRPILGSGPGTFSHNFSKFRPVSFNQTNLWRIRFDRAGNHIAEMVANTGILGILVWLLIIWGLYKASRDQVLAPSGQGGVLLFVFVALVIAQFVYYQNTVLTFMFWLVLAMEMSRKENEEKGKNKIESTVYKASPKKGRKVIVPKKSQVRFFLQRIKLPSFGKAKDIQISFKDFPELNLVLNVVLIIIGVGMLGIYYFASRIYLADVAYAKAVRATTAQDTRIKNLEKAVSLNPYQPAYRVVLSQLYLQEVLNEAGKPTQEQDFTKIQNNTAKAIQEAKLAGGFSPNWVRTQETLGVVYRDIQGIAQGARQWAIQSFRKAILLEPNNPVLYTEVGKLLLADQKTSEAQEEFKKALELKPDYVEGLFQLGLIYFNEGKVDEAISQFEKAINLNPFHSNSLYSLGVAYQRQGKNKKALEMFKRVLQLNPGNEDVLNKIKELE